MLESTTLVLSEHRYTYTMVTIMIIAITIIARATEEVADLLVKSSPPLATQLRHHLGP